MAVLHHLAISPAQTDLWRAFVAALAAGDVVILLDRAVPAASAVARTAGADARCSAVKWLIPAVELTHAALRSLPDGIAAISDEDWWTLIAQHDTLLEWN